MPGIITTSLSGVEPAGSGVTGRRSVGVTGRLLALVMVPVTAILAIAMIGVVTRRATASEALSIDRGVVKLGALVELHGALAALRSLAAFDVRYTELGINRTAAATILGFDHGAGVSTSRARADQALTVLGTSSPIDSGTLQALYTSADSGLAFSDVLARLVGMEDSTSSAITVWVNRLQSQAHQINTGPVLAALESLRVANGFVDVASPQGIDVSLVWFPAPGATAQTTRALLARLGGESAGYQLASQQIRGLGVASVVASLDRIGADPGVRAFDRAVAAALQGDLLGNQSAAVKAAAAGQVFRGYLTRTSLLNGLVLTATAAVRTKAQDLATSERRTFLVWVALSGVLALVSVVVTLGFGRSIAKPLQDLADFAHGINEGRLEANPLSRGRRGPREIRLAFAVFADLVANLRLLDAKANALATCAFDDPVLNQPLPGRLARSLESSVAVLSGSIVERDRLQTHLAHQAMHDALTGIANRAAAVIGIQDAIHRVARTGQAMAVLFMDLNDFKAVNDSHGHEAGDEVLRQTANRLSACVRAGDLVARLGGDEFVIVAELVGGVDGALDLARRVVSAVDRPIDFGPLSITVGIAVGVAMTLDGPEEPLRLLARADAAMYRAKHHDRSAIEIFDADLQRQMVEREDVEGALGRALADPAGGGLLLHFQPVLKAGSGAIAGVEALIRWDRPGHGFLPPDAFIPIAEATSLIIDLDRWVLAEVGRCLCAWADDPDLMDMSVAVNISGRHLLSGQLATYLAGLLAETKIRPDRLTIEITETVLLDDLVAAASELESVRALGIRVAIDDFGTGYTSLAHLQHLPIDMIKIDRSFISQLNLRRGSALVRMVTDLGHAIDLGIIAEGVETDEELNALKAIGADQLQGFLLSRPLPAAALKEWIHRRIVVR